MVIEGRRGEDVVTGRSYRDAPEIDGLVVVRGTGASAAAPGDWLRVRVVEARPYDVVATPLPPAA